MERRDVPSFLAARRFPLASVLASALVRASYRQMFRCFGGVIVPDDSIATVSKTVLWSARIAICHTVASSRCSGSAGQRAYPPAPDQAS